MHLVKIYNESVTNTTGDKISPFDFGQNFSSWGASATSTTVKNIENTSTINGVAIIVNHSQSFQSFPYPFNFQGRLSKNSLCDIGYVTCM